MPGASFFIDQKHEPGADLVFGQLIGRVIVIPRQLPHAADVGLDGPGTFAAEDEVFLHAEGEG